MKVETKNVGKTIGHIGIGYMKQERSTYWICRMKHIYTAGYDISQQMSEQIMDIGETEWNWHDFYWKSWCSEGYNRIIQWPAIVKL